jgi:hypothetical protein
MLGGQTHVVAEGDPSVIRATDPRTHGVVPGNAGREMRLAGAGSEVRVRLLLQDGPGVGDGEGRAAEVADDGVVGYGVALGVLALGLPALGVRGSVARWLGFRVRFVLVASGGGVADGGVEGDDAAGDRAHLGMGMGSLASVSLARRAEPSTFISPLLPIALPGQKERR